jgi:hypothetical protein
MIKRFDFLVSDFYIPFLKFLYKVGKNFIGLHVRMVSELIEIDFTQIRTGEKLGNLLFMDVTLVFAHELVDGCMLTVALWFFFCFHNFVFRIRN